MVLCVQNTRPSHVKVSKKRSLKHNIALELLNLAFLSISITLHPYIFQRGTASPSRHALPSNPFCAANGSNYTFPSALDCNHLLAPLTLHLSTAQKRKIRQIINNMVGEQRDYL